MDRRSNRRLRRWVVGIAALAVVAAAGWFGGRWLWAARHARAADEALGHYDYSGALEHLEVCCRVWPYSLSTRLLAARTARRAGRVQRAEEHLAECEQDGVRPDTALERALLRAQQGELADVESSLRQMLREDHPDAVLILEALAQGYLHKQRLDHCRAMLEDLARRAPEHPWLHCWRGQVFESENLLSLGIPEYRRAVELAPREPRFRLRLALGLVQMDEAREAWPYFQDLLGELPNDPNVRLGAARCLRTLNHPDKALELLLPLVRARPGHAETWAECGRAFADQGQTGEAVRCLRSAFRLNPDEYTYGFDLCTQLRAQGKHQEADALWSKVDRLMREGKRLQQLLALNLQRPNDASIRCEIGQIYLHNRLESAALHWFQAALRANPNHRPTHEALAAYYQNKGDSRAAAYHRQRAGGAP